MMCTWRNRQSIQVLHIIMSGKKKRKSLTHHVEGGAGLWRTGGTSETGVPAHTCTMAADLVEK